MSTSLELPEPPECPVCLQIYDGACAIPRVLPCGHSVCESCLTHLPNPFPQIIRCPCCTQLVKFSSISSLPKNIDLLRLSNLLIPQNPHHVSVKPTKKIDLFGGDQEFGPILWTPMFFIEWKDWILGRDCVLVDGNDASYGRMGLVGVQTRCLWKEHQEVRLLKVGFYREMIGDNFVYSYVGRIMRVLWGMRDGEKEELGLVMRVSGVYGLWCNEEDGGVLLVCESYGGGGLENLRYLEHGCVGIEEEGVESSKNGNILALLMVGMEMCEAVMRLHLGGLSFGCLGVSCFGFDEFGHGFVEINEVLIMGMRVRKMFGDVVLCKGMNDCRELGGSLKNYLLDSFVFASPELLFELSMQKDDRDLGLGKEGYEICCGSDVWSLACVLILFLVGKPFMEEVHDYLCCFFTSLSDEEKFDCEELYMGWLQKVNTLLETRLGLEFLPVKETLLRCFDFDPGSRPVVADVWKCIRGMIIKPKFDMGASLRPEVTKKKLTHALVQGELCKLLMEINEGLEEQKIGATEVIHENGKLYVDHVEKLSVDRDVKGDLSRGHVKCIDLKGHLDCITGLAVGGGFLFSSSFDKTVQIWSLEDFTHIHSFKGHEHKVMAVAFADEEQPLCISGDSGGGICIWGVRIPFGEEPIQKLYEEKDWRYSGIHALAISGTGYFYTGSGDRSIKAWSIQNYTLSCTLTGHKSVVSTLAVCNGVLYSGSWDGTVRLWCLSDHSSLTVLGEDSPGNVTSVLSLAADQRLLISAHENGHLKIWSDYILLKSMEDQDGAVLSVSTDGKMIFAGGWSKTVTVQELVGDDSSKDVIQIGSIHCSSVITALLYWQGILFVGQADRGIKVYRYGV